MNSEQRLLGTNGEIAYFTRDKRGLYQWRIRDKNGDTLAISAEGVVNKELALAQLKRVTRCAVSDCPVAELGKAGD